MECNIVHFHCMCVKLGRDRGRERKGEWGKRRKREREKEGEREREREGGREREGERERGREGGREGDYHEHMIPARYLRILRFCSKCHGEVQLTGVPPQFQRDLVCLLETVLFDYSVIF